MGVDAKRRGASTHTKKKEIRRRNGGKKAPTAKKCDALTARRMPHCNVPLEMINNNIKKKTRRDVGA